MIGPGADLVVSPIRAGVSYNVVGRSTWENNCSMGPDNGQWGFANFGSEEAPGCEACSGRWG